MSIFNSLLKQTRFPHIIVLVFMMIVLCLSQAVVFAETEEIPVAPPTEDPVVPEPEPVPVPEPEPVPEPVPVYPSRILCFGDSITQGYPYVTEPGNGRQIGGYETTLESTFISKGISLKVLNYGVGGENTYGGLNRFNSVISGYQGAYILLLEGTNDFWSGISYVSTIYNLEIMIDKSREAGLTPILSTLTPDTQPDTGGKKNIPNMYNPKIMALAQKKNVPLCDQYNALANSWNSLNFDGLHPNRQGYQVMASAWYPTIQAAIPTSNNPSSPGGQDVADPVEGGGGGCFIATAAFGSAIAPCVQILRNFRDSILLSQPAGRLFVALYYRYSPPIANRIASNQILQYIVRVSLMPIVVVAWLMLTIGTIPSLFGIILIFLLLIYGYRCLTAKHGRTVITSAA